MRETEVPAPELLTGLLCDKINVMFNHLFLFVYSHYTKHPLLTMIGNSAMEEDGFGVVDNLID